MKYPHLNARTDASAQIEIIKRARRSLGTAMREIVSLDHVVQPEGSKERLCDIWQVLNCCDRSLERRIYCLREGIE